MCGIVGVVAKQRGGFYGDVPSLFEEMLYADGLRGMDSTGCFMVTNKNQVDTLKQAANPGIFFQTNAWKKWRSNINSKGYMLVGHNRKATQGEVVSRNAHPFVKGHIALVHNGYIGNYKELDDKAEVDSQAILTTLLSENDYMKALDKIYGAFAIVWYNHRTRTLYLTRNSDRPLVFVHGQDNFIFASEGDMLKWIFKRNKYFNMPEPLDVRPGTVLEIKVDPFTLSIKDIPKKVYVPKYNSFPHRTQPRDWDGCEGFTPNAFSDPTDNTVDAEFDLEPRDPRQTSFGETDIDTKIQKIKQTYPQGSPIFFEPTTFTKYGKGKDEYTQVIGVAWMPGQEPVEALWNVNDSKDTEIYLEFSAPLIGVVSCLLKKNDTVKVALERVRLPRETLQDWVGQDMSRQEWDGIVDHELCNGCGNRPKKSAPEFTAINRKDGHYDVKCDQCTAHVHNARAETRESTN